MVDAVKRKARNHYSLEILPKEMWEWFGETAAIACCDEPCRHEESYYDVV